MKMTPQDFAALEHLIKQRPVIPRGQMSETRWLFDHLYSIPQDARQAWFDRGIYTYLDDSNIEAALRRILKRREAAQ